MPVVIPSELPAYEILTDENVFIMEHMRALTQDIRPLKIAILNLMPTKIETETQLLRLLANTPLQVNMTFIRTATYESKNTDKNHLESFYKTFKEIKNEKFDGMIITGAPIEHIAFEDVDYWEELKEIMDYTKTNVTSTLHICWGAQAALYHHYGVNKYVAEKKIFGVFEHEIKDSDSKILRGFDDRFHVPHSRHTYVKMKDIEEIDGLSVLSKSEDSGVYLVLKDDGSQVFVTGHSEYDEYTLDKEYRRDLLKGLESVDIPKNYYRENNPENEPIVKWRSHANLLFSNWLNYFVYQETPYKL